MTGVLLAVGEGKMGPQHIQQLLETGNSQPPGEVTGQRADCCGISRNKVPAFCSLVLLVCVCVSLALQKAVGGSVSAGCRQPLSANSPPRPTGSHFDQTAKQGLTCLLSSGGVVSLDALTPRQPPPLLSCRMCCAVLCWRLFQVLVVPGGATMSRQPRGYSCLRSVTLLVWMTPASCCTQGLNMMSMGGWCGAFREPAA